MRRPLDITETPDTKTSSTKKVVKELTDEGKTYFCICNEYPTLQKKMQIDMDLHTLHDYGR